MFTGLIQGLGKVKNIQRQRGDLKIRITPLFELNDLRIGESIAVDGVCLTVAEFTEQDFQLDVSGETLKTTTLSNIKSGDLLNLERALRLSDRLGGHLVSGHVDGIGKILRTEAKQRSWSIRIGINPYLLRYILKKGSIAVDGVSLTINHCENDFFEVNIIPHTGTETTLLKKGTGRLVNIETDLIGKYIEKFYLKDRSSNAKSSGSTIDLEMLIKQGFGD